MRWSCEVARLARACGSPLGNRSPAHAMRGPADEVENASRHHPSVMDCTYSRACATTHPSPDTCSQRSTNHVQPTMCATVPGASRSEGPESECDTPDSFTRPQRRRTSRREDIPQAADPPCQFPGVIFAWSITQGVRADPHTPAMMREHGKLWKTPVSAPYYQALCHRKESPYTNSLLCPSTTSQPP